MLAVLAQRLGFVPGVRRKEALIEELYQQVTHHLPPVLEHVRDQEKLLLSEDAHHGGFVNLVALAHKYQAQFSLPYPRYFSARRDEDVSLLMLLVDAYQHKLLEPLIEPLKALLPPPAKAAVKTVAKLPSGYTWKQRWRQETESRPIGTFSSELVATAELTRV